MIKAWMKSKISQETQANIRNMRRQLSYFKEYLLGGSVLRQKILTKLLEYYYESKFRRQWYLSSEQPHFTDHQFVSFRFAFSDQEVDPYSFYRGFFSSEVLQQGDYLLDIGCGDGFFAKRFFAQRCTHIDAIDIEPTAIASCLAYNSSAKISYYLKDAVKEPFPQNKYDVIVWDGAIGHFPAETTHQMLEKICQSLNSDGVFVGSESLGTEEGHDHLQFFESLSDLHLLFKPYFKIIKLRCVSYPINNGAFLRREAYWRCANNDKRLQETSWQDFSEIDAIITY